jgi:hypothetical protein
MPFSVSSAGSVSRGKWRSTISEQITEEIGHKGHEDRKGQARSAAFLFFVLFFIFVAQTFVSFVAMDGTT